MSRRNSPQGTLLNKMWLKAEEALKQFFLDDLSSKKLKSADAVVLWMGFRDDRCVAQRLTAAPVHYMRPWRPTFLLLQQVAAPFSSPQLGSGRDGKVVTCTVAVDEAGLPHFYTPHQLLASYNKELKWKLSVAFLSTLDKPMIHSAGRFNIVFPANREAVQWWPGHIPSDVAAHRRSGQHPPQQDMDPDEAEVDDNDDDDDVVVVVVVEGLTSETKDDDGMLDFDKDLLDLWDRLAPEEEPLSEPPKGVAPRRSSSISSSSSSSSSTPTATAKETEKDMFQGTKDNDNKKRKAEMLQDADPGSQAPGGDHLNHTTFGRHFTSPDSQTMSPQDCT